MDKIHLDVAGAGRVSHAVLEAEIAHLGAEAQVGAYVAEVAAEPAITAGRTALGAMVGLAGGDVFFQDGASRAFLALLEAWPLTTGARVGIVPSEFGSNARALRHLAGAREWTLVTLPVDDLGRIMEVPKDLDLVAFPQVPSQRGIAQPAADVVASGVPVVLDVAQSLGQTEVPRGAAAYVGTSRKWLCGPRGVGFGMVDPAWQARLPDPPTLGGIEYDDLRRFDGNDPHVAGRIGLSLAARTWSPALMPVLQAAASAARVLLQGAGGWQVVEPIAELTGITTLAHATADPVATRLRLLAEGFVTSSVPTIRADDVAVPLLRVSTAAWVTPVHLEALAAALERCTR